MSAQEYLEKLAAEHKERVDAYRAKQEAQEQEKIEGIRQKYDNVLAAMPVELAEFYSFDPEDEDCPLKLSIPLHADIHVGYWGYALRFKCVLDRPTDMQLSSAIDLAKRYYREPEPEPELMAEEAPEPVSDELTRVEQAEAALNSFNYQRAIAVALLEVAVQLGEIDRLLVAMNKSTARLPL